MNDAQWAALDDYYSEELVRQDAVLAAALADSEAAGLPGHHVAPNQGKFLNLLARIHGARRILEIGTLGGYSAIWLARALPADGRLVTLEFEPRHVE
ncbi:methyltransferase, partial [Pseudomonas sp. MWU12-2534b]